MNTFSLFAPRLRRALLIGLLLALGASTASLAQDRIRTTASTGIFTLSPRQTVRLHLVDAGRTGTHPSTARIELRDDRGTLLGFRTATLRPGVPLHLVLRAANLLGSRPFLYIRAIAVIETGVDNLLSGPVFSAEIQSEAADSLAITTAQCPIANMGDPPPPHMTERDCGGGCDVIRDLLAPGER
ncbi:MAG: hypothetical protein ABJC13_15870 [Acidobacteriota bacterium]